MPSPINNILTSKSEKHTGYLSHDERCSISFDSKDQAARLKFKSELMSAGSLERNPSRSKS